MDRGATEDARRLVERIEARYGDRFDTADQTELLRLQALLALAEHADDEEARVLQEIIRLDPLDGGAFLQLGRHSRRKGDAATAEHYFEQAAEIEGFEAPAKLSLAELMVEEDRLAEALPLLRRAQALDPRDDVQAFLEHVERALQRR
jgi:cytochrome c-type biogenesis protein CcmH/NrfG